MRAAAFFSVAIVAVGAYLAIAATLALSPAWIALGALGIAFSAAIGLMASGTPAATR